MSEMPGIAGKGVSSMEEAKMVLNDMTDRTGTLLRGEWRKK